MKRKVRPAEWVSIALGIAGVGVAAYPLLLSAHATPLGLVLIALSMIAYSVGSVYYADVRWELPRITVNAWQVFIGGVLLAPVAFAMHHQENHFTTPAWLALAWLVVPVSILAVQLWLRLLKSDAVRASLWLYLCPVFRLPVCILHITRTANGLYLCRHRAGAGCAVISANERMPDDRTLYAQKHARIANRQLLIELQNNPYVQAKTADVYIRTEVVRFFIGI